MTIPADEQMMQNNIQRAIQAQLAVNKDTNLLYHNLKAVAKVDRGFIHTLEQAVQQPVDQYDIDLRAGFAARECLRTVFQLNQYLHISSTKRDELRQLYIDSWQQITNGRDIEEMLISYHYPRLQAWIASLYPSSFLSAFNATRQIKPVLNKQYSPAFQLELLGIDLTKLKQPILDIGCGSEGRLVRHLRQKGYQAFGIDRMIDFESDYLLETDWFEYEFKQGTWGSIISNMAFSNHYQYIRLYEPNKIYTYECIFACILDALEVDGGFYYAPPAPDLEKSIPGDRFTIHTRLIDDIPYAMHVKKIR